MQAQSGSLEPEFPLVAFVECNSYQAETFAGQIGQHLRQTVSPILLSRIRETTAAVPKTCKLMLTSYFHYSELRDLMQDHAVAIRPLILDVITDLRVKLSRVPRGKIVGLVTRFAGVHEVEVEISQEVLRRQLALETFPFNDGDTAGLSEFLRSVDVLICPDAALDAVMESKTGEGPEIVAWKAILDPNEAGGDSSNRTVSSFVHRPPSLAAAATLVTNGWVDAHGR